MRSAARANSAAARIGKAISTRMEVTSVFQVKIGIRNIVMPGARMVTIVVMKLTAPRMVPKPASARPKTQRSPPRPGEYTVLDSGAYANQPNDAAPCGVKKPNPAIEPPKKKNQYASMFSRGNA